MMKHLSKTALPFKPCRHPLCAEITRDRSGYCSQHIETAVNDRRQTRARKTTRKAYGSARWKRVRQAYKSRHPLCEVCGSRGATRAAQVVDHVLEISDGGAMHDAANLLSLCHRCHGSKTKQMQRARGNGYIRECVSMFLKLKEGEEGE